MSDFNASTVPGLDDSEPVSLRKIGKILQDNIAGRLIGSASAAVQSVFRIASAAAGTNARSIKASSGILYKAEGYNANAAARYLKIYNKASAPTVGTDVPVWTKYLAPQSDFTLDFPMGLTLSTGIAIALTSGVADNDVGALTAADVLALNIQYS